MSDTPAPPPPGSPTYRPNRPREGAPNVVMFVLDDTGFAQLGSFGASLDTPVIDGLAAGGLRYNAFHVTALCSPTRACLLTGRNHHAVGMGFLADIPTSYPGYGARFPRTAAPLPRVLRDAGYSTMAIGKWHLTPRGERNAAGPFDRWPLGLGFERYYGFLGGDTNAWAPNLACDNHYIEAPRTPEEGYHVAEDLADHAIRYVQDQKQAAPEQPFFLYWGTLATHAPHHVAPEWVTPYEGRFDHGWEREREQIFARQVADGIVPESTTLTPPPLVGPGLRRPRRRCQAGLQPDARGLRRLHDPQRRATRAFPRLPPDHRRARQHHRDGPLRQRRQRRRRTNRDVE